jgi:hypothetical protein
MQEWTQLTSGRLLNVFHQLIHTVIVKLGLQDFMLKCHLQQFRAGPGRAEMIF